MPKRSGLSISTPVINSGIVNSGLQNGSVALTTVPLKVVTECTNPAKIGWAALILLLDEPECQGHIPVGLGCKVLYEGDHLCMPSLLSL